MFKALIATLAVCGALTMTVRAADKPAKPELTEEQKALRKELLEKYDKNKDGKLDAEERKAVSSDDKPKLAKAGLGGRGSRGGAKPGQ